MCTLNTTESPLMLSYLLLWFDWIYTLRMAKFLCKYRRISLREQDLEYLEILSGPCVFWEVKMLKILNVVPVKNLANDIKIKTKQNKTKNPITTISPSQPNNSNKKKQKSPYFFSLFFHISALSIPFLTNCCSVLNSVEEFS